MGLTTSFLCVIPSGWKLLLIIASGTRANWQNSANPCALHGVIVYLPPLFYVWASIQALSTTRRRNDCRMFASNGPLISWKLTKPHLAIKTSTSYSRKFMAYPYIQGKIRQASGRSRIKDVATKGRPKPRKNRQDLTETEEQEWGSTCS